MMQLLKTIPFRRYGRLPGIPSKLIKKALVDLRAIERDGLKCDGVADALTNRTLVTIADNELSALCALKYLSAGALTTGFYYLGLHLPSNFVTDVAVPKYEDNRHRYKQRIKALADALEVYGY